MITKIFYSLVLFPNIRYQEPLLSWYVLVDIVERQMWIIECIFSKDTQSEIITFTYFEYLTHKSWYITKNWGISGNSIDLLEEVFQIIMKKDHFDFHFFKPKEFYYLIPFWVVLNITSKCNLFCDYCFNDYDYPLDTRNTRKTLGLDDFKKIIDELYDAGSRDIILTWWEPFSCVFLWDLLDYLQWKNIFVRINTNGTLLFDKVLERLDSNYSIHLMVSMHEFNNKDYFELNKKWASHIYGINDLKAWRINIEISLINSRRYNPIQISLWDFLLFSHQKIYSILRKYMPIF